MHSFPGRCYCQFFYRLQYILQAIKNWRWEVPGTRLVECSPACGAHWFGLVSTITANWLNLRVNQP